VRAALPKIFDLLFQANGAGPKSGLGLGLALVRGIVEAHDGRVSGHSEGRGRGAEFAVRLPCGALLEEDNANRPEGPQPE
jgi:two-component system CheB/CheR fusion protein